MILPEYCYNFYVIDSRDGEKWGPYATILRAKEQLKWLRERMAPHVRCVYYLNREVSERKVKKLLEAKPI